MHRLALTLVLGALLAAPAWANPMGRPGGTPSGDTHNEQASGKSGNGSSTRGRGSGKVDLGEVFADVAIGDIIDLFDGVSAADLDVILASLNLPPVSLAAVEAFIESEILKKKKRRKKRRRRRGKKGGNASSSGGQTNTAAVTAARKPSAR